MKKFIAGLSAVALLFAGAQALPGTVLEKTGAGIAASAVTVNTTEVDLYYVKAEYRDRLSLPANKPSQFQLSVSGAKNVTYSLGNGYTNVQVSDTGLLTVKPGTMYYWYSEGGGRIRSYTEPQTDRELYGITERGLWFGDQTIRIYADGQYYYVTVHLKDYAEECYTPFLQKYIKENITSSMTDEQKIAAICALPAQYDYNALYQGGMDIIYAGGGDCWAGTNLNVDIAHEMGLEAWARNANHEGASGHRNAVVLLNGNYYILEQFGSWWKKADPYFSFESPTISAEGTNVYQYDGRNDLTSLTVPSTISGEKVVEVGDSCFTRSTVLKDLKTLTVPEGVVRVGQASIYNLASLETVYLPASMTELGPLNFGLCPNLKNVVIASGNPNYVSQNGFILSKDKTKLIACFGSGDMTVPSTVKTIGEYAFAHNPNITSVTVPASVTAIEEGAFYDCEKLDKVTVNGSGLTTLGDYVFASDYALKEIHLPASLKTIGEDIARYSYNSVIYCPAGSAIESYAKENSLKYETDAASCAVSGKLFSDTKGTALNGAAVTLKGDKTYTAAVSGNGYSVSVPAGTYTMTVAAKGYVTRTYTVKAASGPVTQNAELYALGDINGSGAWDAHDIARIQAHIKTVRIMNDYECAVADMDGNGSVSASDATRLIFYYKFMS